MLRSGSRAAFGTAAVLTELAARMANPAGAVRATRNWTTGFG